MLFQELNLVRKIGNNAAHGKKVSTKEALVCLRSIFRFATYISKYYSQLNPEIDAFNENFIGKPEGAINDKTTKELKARAEQAEAKLKSYVHDYMAIMGDEIANMVVDTMTMHDDGAVAAGLDAMEAAGCEECFMVPATSEISEVDRLAEIVAKR